METSTQLRRRIAAALFAAAFASLAMAADIGQIKVAKGPVTIERDGRMLPAAVGMRVQTADVVTTGADASVGITMGDNSLLSAGPNSTLLLERYEFDATTSRGRSRASAMTAPIGSSRPSCWARSTTCCRARPTSIRAKRSA